MRVINLAGASAFQHNESGQIYTAGDDGVFELPHPVGVELTTRHASMWQEESAHSAAAHGARVEELRNPHVLPKVVAQLRERAAAAEARLAALEQHLGLGQPHEFDGLLATLQGSAEQWRAEHAGESDTPAEPVPAGKPTRARKQTAPKAATAKKTTAKRTQAKIQGGRADLGVADEAPAVPADPEDEVPGTPAE